MRERRIAVFGSSQVGPDHPAWAEAHTLGRDLATAGFAVVSGGYGGVMEAVSQGAREAGGHTIGLTVGAFAGRGANSAIVEEIHAPDLLERLRNFTAHADGFIALHGGVGTLLEIALLWNLKILKAHDGPPVWLVGSGWDEIHRVCREHLAIRDKDFAHVAILPNGAAAVSAARAFFEATP